MRTELSRRSLITGLISLIAAPAIVRAGSLMPVHDMIDDATWTQIHDATPIEEWTLSTWTRGVQWRVGQQFRSLNDQVVWTVRSIHASDDGEWLHAVLHGKD